MEANLEHLQVNNYDNINRIMDGENPVTNPFPNSDVKVGAITILIPNDSNYQRHSMTIVQKSSSVMQVFMGHSGGAERDFRWFEGMDGGSLWDGLNDYIDDIYPEDETHEGGATIWGWGYIDE